MPGLVWYSRLRPEGGSMIFARITLQRIRFRQAGWTSRPNTRASLQKNGVSQRFLLGFGECVWKRRFGLFSAPWGPVNQHDSVGTRLSVRFSLLLQGGVAKYPT